MIIEKIKLKRKKTFNFNSLSELKEIKYHNKKTDDQILKEMTLFFFLPNNNTKKNILKLFT